MKCKRCVILVFVIGYMILTLLGCGSDKDIVLSCFFGGPGYIQQFNQWNVVSVNDMEPSSFLAILIAEALNETEGVAFIVNEGKRAEVHEFAYVFRDSGVWSLVVKFDVLAHDASWSPSLQFLDRNEFLASVEGIWSGTYQVGSDMLTLTSIDTQEVRVRRRQGRAFEEIAVPPLAKTEAVLLDTFRMRLLDPFAKTAIACPGDGSVMLTIPGASSGTIRLEGWSPQLSEGT